eukprot:TRINITY_DN9337_c0_g1_i2.p1 TRINITY_DN9337_c0_g1~~TRINITY_DN9337_c0_g1_i2.p1  ORF type:complete len:281 (+),score=63.08 TRINITY_DN9337_c0_g1_i2:670-1512(+)
MAKEITKRRLLEGLVGVFKRTLGGGLLGKHIRMRHALGQKITPDDGSEIWAERTAKWVVREMVLKGEEKDIGGVVTGLVECGWWNVASVGLKYAGKRKWDATMLDVQKVADVDRIPTEHLKEFVYSVRRCMTQETASRLAAHLTANPHVPESLGAYSLQIIRNHHVHKALPVSAIPQEPLPPRKALIFTPPEALQHLLRTGLMDTHSGIHMLLIKKFRTNTGAVPQQVYSTLEEHIAAFGVMSYTDQDLMALRALSRAHGNKGTLRDLVDAAIRRRSRRY